MTSLIYFLCNNAYFAVGLLIGLNRRLLIFLLAGALLGIGGSQLFKYVASTAVETEKSAQTDNISSASTPNANKQTVPTKVLDVLKYVDTFNEPKEGYEGGRKFGNYEGLLPIKTPKGRKINYREWDVNPKKRGVNRGAERLVTGDDKSAWYTKDHYKSFTKIR